MRPIYLAEFKYKKHVFRCASYSQIMAHLRLLKGVRLWCEANKVRALPVLKMVDERRYDLHCLVPDVPRVDSWDIGIAEGG